MHLAPGLPRHAPCDVARCAHARVAFGRAEKVATEGSVAVHDADGAGGAVSEAMYAGGGLYEHGAAGNSPMRAEVRRRPNHLPNPEHYTWVVLAL